MNNFRRPIENHMVTGINDPMPARYHSLPPPSFSIHTIHGYELFQRAGQRAEVVRTYTTRSKKEDGSWQIQTHRETMTLESDFGDGPEAIEAKKQLTEAWKQYRDWHDANTDSRS